MVCLAEPTECRAERTADGLERAAEHPATDRPALGAVGLDRLCQLTTNASAIALVSQRLANVKDARKTALAYTADKVVVYTPVGGLILGLGLQLDLATIPVAVVARRALGPLMLLIGV
jgi:cytochrome c-type biogenesis protein